MLNPFLKIKDSTPYVYNGIIVIVLKTGLFWDCSITPYVDYYYYTPLSKIYNLSRTTRMDFIINSTIYKE